jgi:hypothetical protein
MFFAPISLPQFGSDSAPEMKMRALSVLDELKELLATTEQCAEQARLAKQQAQKYTQYYKKNAEQFRKLAARSPFPEIQARLLRIAVANERLCNIADGTHTTAQTEDDAVTPVTRRDEAAVRRTEDPVSQAHRHVAEAEARIERQKALVARLSDSGKYSALAGQAREILSTLQQTLQLARDHLELELKK